MNETLDGLVAEMVETGILFEEARTEFERRFIQRVLEQHRGNRSSAAQALGMHRNTLRRKLEELELAARTTAAPKAKTRARAAGR